MKGSKRKSKKYGTAQSVNYELWMIDDAKKLTAIVDPDATNVSKVYRAFLEDWILRFRERKYSAQQIQEIVFRLQRTNHERKIKLGILDDTLGLIVMQIALMLAHPRWIHVLS